MTKENIQISQTIRDSSTQTTENHIDCGIIVRMNIHDDIYRNKSGSSGNSCLHQVSDSVLRINKPLWSYTISDQAFRGGLHVYCWVQIVAIESMKFVFILRHHFCWHIMTQTDVTRMV